jgi:RNA polymerase sigma-70 factor (ECF subfamily)
VSEARLAVELAARNSYGTLVAWLTTRCHDVALAEDAMGDALEAALRQWPVHGVPSNPEAWLLTAARRRVIDRRRRDTTRINAAQRLRQEAEEWTESPFTPALPDRRLELMFACVHEQIEPEMRTPLMLQAVLGLDAKDVAATFLVKPATMSQRLVRAKRRIQEAGLAMAVPEDLTAHIAPLLEAVYAAYGTGWQHDGNHAGLTAEAIFLGRLLCDLAPSSAEAKGLLALMLYAESRKGARRHDDSFIPLEEQDTSRWNHDLIAEAEQTLRAAAEAGEPGPFQLEAAIQSMHAHRAVSGQTDWHGIERLYSVLAVADPSLGASIGWAAALSRIGACDRGLGVLDALPPDRVARHQPYWAVRAHILAKTGHPEAAATYQRAIGLTDDSAIRAWLADHHQAGDRPHVPARGDPRRARHYGMAKGQTVIQLHAQASRPQSARSCGRREEIACVFGPRRPLRSCGEAVAWLLTFLKY